MHFGEKLPFVKFGYPPPFETKISVIPFGNFFYLSDLLPLAWESCSKNVICGSFYTFAMAKHNKTAIY